MSGTEPSDTNVTPFNILFIIQESLEMRSLGLLRSHVGTFKKLSEY